MGDSLLAQAWKLHLKGQFQATNSLLEPQILKYRSDPEFYRILGLSCLRLGDWSGGETYLARSLQLEPDNRQQVEMALVAVAMKKRDLSEAVRLALAVLDREPRCRPARRALERLRIVLASPQGNSSLGPKDWTPLLPKVSSSKNVRWTGAALRVLISLILLLAVAFGVWWGAQFVSLKGLSLPEAVTIEQRPGSTVLSAGDENSTTEIPAVSGTRLTLSPEEIRQTLKKIQDFFQKYQDSACRLEINRLLLSNASRSIKEKVRGLIAYLHAPDFAKPEPSVAYQDVRRFPELYEGCTVEWKGVVSRLVSGTQEITFDLLLGYEDGQVLEGVIPVRLGFASLLKNSQVVDLLGQVKLLDGKWAIEGSGIHVIGYRAP